MQEFNGSLGLSGVKTRLTTEGTKNTEFLKIFLCELRDLCGENGANPPITREPI